MSRIKGRDTKPEMLVRRFLHINGFRYKFHDKRLSGQPDIVLPKYKTVVFLHGCFGTDIQTANILLYQKQNRLVVKLNKWQYCRERGWKIIHLWECNLNMRRL